MNDYHSRNRLLWYAVGLVPVLLLLLGVNQWLREERAARLAAISGSAEGSRAPIQRLSSLSQLPPGQVQHIEVANFHRTLRHGGCLEAERLTRQTLETYFADRLSSGEMSLVVADVQQPENVPLAEKYDAWGSSLYLGILKGGVEYTCPLKDIWFTLGDEAKFMASLRDSIDAVYRDRW